MKNIIIYLSVLMISNIYAQCDDYSQTQCSNDNNCEWVEDIETGNCGNLWGDDCELNPECNWNCDWVDDYMGWCNYSCDGGNYQIDNSYCEEELVDLAAECVDAGGYFCGEYNGGCIPIERLCNNINDCEDGSDEINCENCSELEELECDNDANCNWIGGSVDCQIINSELSCNSNNCDWTEDIEYGNCSNYNNSSSCSNANEQCGWTLCYGGGYGEWSYCCIGGAFQTDNSYCDGETGYCEETEYQLGDVNQDFSINVLDVIAIVDLVLLAEYNILADMNSNDITNIQDVIMLINNILEN